MGDDPLLSLLLAVLVSLQVASAVALCRARPRTAFAWCALQPLLVLLATSYFITQSHSWAQMGAGELLCFGGQCVVLLIASLGVAIRLVDHAGWVVWAVNLLTLLWFTLLRFFFRIF
jgi:hypothetical protein